MGRMNCGISLAGRKRNLFFLKIQLHLQGKCRKLWERARDASDLLSKHLVMKFRFDALLC